MAAHMRRNAPTIPTFAAGFAITLVGVGLIPQNAHALPPIGPLDASSVEISFVNATDVLASSEAGDTFEYLNVANIEGNQIDATLTVLETFNLVAEDPYFFMSEFIRDYVNTEYPEREDLVESGCYRDQLNDDGDPWGQPIETTLASDYLVGSETFDKSTAWNAGSNFIDGSLLTVADEAEGDDYEDQAINTSINGCGGVLFFPSLEVFEFPAYVRYQIDFTTGGNPVELFNFTLSALDIDGGQYLRLFSPLPDSYRVFDSSLLEICGPSPLAATTCEGADDYAGSSTFLGTSASSTLEFYGDDASDDGEVYEWAADATYTEPTSTLSYQFGVRSGGGGFLGVRFDPIDWDAGSGGSSDRDRSVEDEELAGVPTLASTGATEATLGSSLESLLVIGCGLGLIVLATRLRRASHR